MLLIFNSPFSVKRKKNYERVLVMWNKFVVGAFLSLIFSCVLTAPVENTDGQKQAPKNKLKVQPAQNVNQGVRNKQKSNVNNAEQRTPQSRHTSSEGLGQAMDDLTAEDIIRDVLITIRDNPIIMKELLEDKEKELDKALESRAESDESMFDDEDDQTFQQPPPQLAQMPKTVQKKGDYNWRKHLDSSSSESSNKDVPYRYRFRDNSESKETESSSESESSSEQSNSKDSKADSNELTKMKRKRVPEIPEQTIDLTSFPQEENSKRSNLHPRVYKALANQRHFKNPRNKAGPVLGNDPFINPLPILTDEDIHSIDNVKIPSQIKNLQTENTKGTLKQRPNSSPKNGAPVKNELAALSKSKTKA
ncbi:hypothetical protein KUTeg_013841 [Tegillarca granosa]|uniref:Uncharacterized protein n=1 Tax=Tegillarca granosa TaxID=220873 RepID=A0ABQ9EZC6_TEGGR|nr:hypothetical protein KUTeg_013841 [Tegillarca granosa]